VDTVLFVVQFAPLVLVGALIAAFRPSQPIGWLLLTMGIAFGVGTVLASGARYFYASAPTEGALMELTSNQLFKLVFVGAAVVLLLFPTGRLPSPGWRWLLAALGGLVAIAIAAELVTPGPIADYLVAKPPANPLAVPALASPALSVGRVGFLLFAILVGLAAGSLIVRYRGAASEQRLQLKWFALASALWAATALADGLFRAFLAAGRDWPELPFQVFYVLGATAMALGIGIAILRHRLFDVELVISRTVAFASLAALITLFYVFAVAGLGTLFAAGSSSRLLLAVIATACVAAAFQPLRARLEQFARGLVYGPRAGPYETLAGFTERLQGIGQGEDIVPAMARTLALGTGCEAATVWVRERGQDVVAATWPAGQSITEASATRCVPVLYAGEELGRLAVRRHPGEQLGPTDERLMDRLALQAGLVLRNERLQHEVGERLDELQASRQRLVVVQDEERRRLERDLHDGAQQDLVALRMKLGLARALAHTENSQVAPVLDELQADLGEALDSLRALARGVYPPLLEAEGLRPALAARARPLPFTVDIQCGNRRYPREVEGALYFCCSEALQNVAKHAAATRVAIRVWNEAGSLLFEVKDDGRGASPSLLSKGSGLQHIRDRLDALGGCLDLDTAAGVGVSVRGRLPLSD